MARMRARSALVLGVSVALLAACGGGDAEEPGTDDTNPQAEEGEDVTITWWHNATSDPLAGFWEDVATEFEEANPGVTVETQGFQNEELQRTLIPNALRSGDAPDLFMVWGGGELADQVEAGYLRDLTDEVTAEVEAIGAVADIWSQDGRNYGLPYTFGPEGFWYNTEHFEQAGVEVPTTLDELYAVNDALKAEGLTPIAVGAGDGWPAAHYWYNFALKSCTPEVLQQAQAEFVFDDPCFVEAGELLQEFIDTEPFNEGYLATSAQQGAGSSAGMVATGNATMELMGPWNPGVMGGILQEETGDESASPPEFLGWFNFPGVPDAGGDPNAVLGGGDAFGVSADAPDVTVELLKYISSVDVQTRFGETGSGVPVTAGSESSIEDPNLRAAFDALQAASYVQLWLDTAYGPVVGGAMNEGIVNMFGGAGTPQDIVDGMKAAVETL